jgi:hypothetical protein
MSAHEVRRAKTHWFNGKFGHSQLTGLVKTDFAIWDTAKGSATCHVRH